MLILRLLSVLEPAVDNIDRILCRYSVYMHNKGRPDPAHLRMHTLIITHRGTVEVTHLSRTFTTTNISAALSHHVTMLETSTLMQKYL